MKKRDAASIKLGKTIQKLRKSKGFSQEKLAEIMDISRTHVGHIEQGIKSPSFEVMNKLAKALNVPLKELF